MSKLLWGLNNIICSICYLVRTQYRMQIILWWSILYQSFRQTWCSHKQSEAQRANKINVAYIITTALLPFARPTSTRADKGMSGLGATTSIFIGFPSNWTLLYLLSAWYASVLLAKTTSAEPYKGSTTVTQNYTSILQKQLEYLIQLKQ